MKVFDANPTVVQLLVERGVLLNRPTDSVEHSYPHCWRCHNPIIFRATPQWFIAMDRPLDATAGLDATLRGRALAEIDTQVRWVPDWGRSPHPRDGGEPAGLVHQPAADLGRAHPGAPLRRLRRVGGRAPS